MGLILDGCSQRVDKHVVDLLAFFLGLEDVCETIFELHDVLLVESLLLVEFTLGLAKLKFQRVNFIRLLRLMLQDQ